MIQLGVIVVYLLLLVGLGLSANRLFRGTAKDYMLASHSIGPFLLLMSLFGTTMTAFALVGSTGRAYVMGAGVYGLLASASGIVHSLCFLLIGVPLWSLGRRHGYTTQIQFFRDRLESNFIGYLLFPILVFLVVGYLMVGVLGGGAVVQTVTAGTFGDVDWLASSNYGVPSWLASGVICCVVLTYVFYGGMRGTAWANTFQTSVFMALGVVTFFVIAKAIGGTDNLFENLVIATKQVPEIQLARAKIPKPVFFSFLLIPLSVGMFPHIFQHWLTARSANAFKLSIIVHPIFIMIVWVPCVLLGIWASGPESGIPPGTDENAVLGMLVQTHAGPVLAGLLTAGILAAIMSSLDSQFLCVGTMFTEDILLHNRSGEQLNEQQVVRAARGFIIGVVGLTYVLSLILPRSVFDLGLWSFSGFTGLFPLVFAAIYWRRLTAAGAIGGVLSVLVTWSILFWRSGFGSNARYSFPEAPVNLGVATLPQLHPVVFIFVVAAIAIVVISLFSRPPSEKTLAKFFRR
ncbi:MAG: sodium:solute symporter family protein [Planctomycetota bacterium]|nr:sodium:solute symporter family protein [Planctomycetota bacterium]